MNPNLTAISTSLCGLLLASLSGHAETILWLDDQAGGETQEVSAAVDDTGNAARTRTLYTVGDHVANQPFNVGDSFTVALTVTVGANTKDPAPIPWANSSSIAFGINDADSQNGVGFTFNLTGAGKVRIGYDLSVSGGGNFGHLSGTSGSWVDGEVDSEKFFALNDTADLLFTVTKVAEDGTTGDDALALTLKWGTTGTRASFSIPSSAGVNIDTLDKFLFRINKLVETESADIEVTNFELNTGPAAVDTLLWLRNGDGEKTVESQTAEDGLSVTSPELYTAATHLPNQPFNVGDTFTASFTVTVADHLNGADPIPWANAASIAFAINDEDAVDPNNTANIGHAVGMTFDLAGPERVRVGYDLNAPGAGNFGTLSGTSGNWVPGTVASEKLLNVGDTIDLVFTVTKTGKDATGDALDLTLQWGATATPATHSIPSSTGLNLDTLDKFLFRINSLGTGVLDTAKINVSNFQVTLGPTAATPADLTIESIVVNPDNSVTLIWTSEAAATYALDLSANLTGWSEYDGAIPSAGATTGFTVPAGDVLAAAVDGHLFFQVRKP